MQVKLFNSEMLHLNKRSFYFLLLTVSVLLVLSPLQAAAAGLQSTPDEVVKVRTAWSADGARPGDSIILAIIADIKKGFHINADARQVKPLENFKPYPTKVAITAVSDEITIESPRYPLAVPFNAEYAGGNLMSFEGRAIIYLPMKLNETIGPGKKDIKLVFEYQACSDTYCLFPQKIKFEDSLVAVASPTGVSQINQALFAGYHQSSSTPVSGNVNFDLFGWTFAIDVSSGFGIVLLLLTAALGGMLLNFTPCVLPLIPIKIISLAHVAQDRKQCFLLGFSMFLGVLVFWLALGILIALVSDFSAANQLFQYPPFTILVGLLIGTMATGMFGFFNVRLPNFIYLINPEQDTLKGSFGLGILAAILSTPCTAPFMGAAAAWAATRPPATTLVTFAAIGTGMALPYLVLSANPAWVEKMPKTGPASNLIKQVMGLFMLAAALYFIGIGVAALFAEPPNVITNLYWWPVMLFSAAAGGWLAYRTIQIAASKGLKTFFAGLGVTIMALSAWGAVQLTDRGPVDWVYYTPERFSEASGNRKVIVMVFTAEWCLNCKVLEQGVFRDPAIAALFAREEIVPMKVDITGSNPAGKAKLKEVGALTIPLLVIFSPNGKQLFKSDFYTADQVREAVTKALQDSGSSS
jgi:thiol:disulfide interchange protein DsbD